MQFYKKVCINILIGVGTVIIPVVANDNGCDYDSDISILNIDETMNQNNNTSEYASTVGSSPEAEYRPNQNQTFEYIRLPSGEVDCVNANRYCIYSEAQFASKFLIKAKNFFSAVGTFIFSQVTQKGLVSIIGNASAQSEPDINSASDCAYNVYSSSYD